MSADPDLGTIALRATSHRLGYGGFAPGTPLEVRLWGRVTVSPSGCWDYTGSRNGDGYGSLLVRGRARGAHRVAWELCSGPIPAGLCVCHRCDNPRCCRPAHLFLGTHQENIADRNAKGRSTGGATCGTALPHAKLTDGRVMEARSRRGAGETNASLAKEFGVSPMVMSRAVRGLTWRHVVEAIA